MILWPMNLPMNYGGPCWFPSHTIVLVFYWLRQAKINYILQNQFCKLCFCHEINKISNWVKISLRILVPSTDTRAQRWKCTETQHFCRDSSDNSKQKAVLVCPSSTQVNTEAVWKVGIWSIFEGGTRKLAQSFDPAPADKNCSYKI